MLMNANTGTVDHDNITIESLGNLAQNMIPDTRLAPSNETDLPLNFHPTAIRASAALNTPNGAVGATGGNAKLSSCAALEPVAAMDPA